MARATPERRRDDAARAGRYTALVADPPLGIWGPVFVGATFYLNIILFRDVSGAIINPAVAWGLWIVGIIEGNQEKKWNIVLYVLSELIGAFCAGYATRFVMWRQRIMARLRTPHMHTSYGCAHLLILTLAASRNLAEGDGRGAVR